MRASPQGVSRGGARVESVPGSFNRCHQPEVIIMFGLNRAEVIGRLGADVTINRVGIPFFLQVGRP